MTEVASPAPVQQKQKQQRLTLAFLYATKGEAVLKQLGEEKSYAKVFPAATAQIIRDYHKGSLKKENYAEGDFIDQVVKPVMEDFLDIACPSAKSKPPIAQWVFKQYLSHRETSGRRLLRRQKSRPMKASDLHNIGENITYFDNLKGSKAFKESGAKPDLMQYKTYAAFAEMLAPYRARKEENKSLAMAFSMSPKEKARLMAETTVLYDGPEGKVVVAHSPEASKYWGNNTKWCVAGSAFRMPKAGRRILGLNMRLPHFNIANAGITFPTHNKRSPIIVLIPKGRQDDKVGLIEKVYYTATDDWHRTLPQSHQSLMQACLASLSENARKGIEAWMPGNNSAPAGSSQTDPALQEKVKQELNNVKVQYKKPDAALWGDRDFVRAAVRQDSTAIYYAARKLRRDRAFVSSLLEDCVELPFNIDKRTKRDLTINVLEQFNDLYFKKNTPVKTKIASLGGRVRELRRSKIRRPKDAEMTAYKVKALEQMAEEGNMEKFVNYSRRYKATWADAETFFAADPADTIRKIEAETPTKRSLLHRLHP